MEITFDTTVTPACLRFAGEMTIYAAAGVHREMFPRFEICNEMTFDLSAVEEIDSAGLQLLLLARQHAEAIGKAFALAAISPAVGELLELFGLGAFFGVPALGAPIADMSDADEPA
ncbi:lipid asymmetry maintenance protein MlaB [Azoarcus sp. KH32C]|uniref:STAS domain-containing protein n=1 Tax=Azoarcus sp. KH32C TaxID=748247 RepID=UPI00023869C2|nr:STAS domain-containing protein [Azoarcus sp. KH32C]BAL26474.1 hypothetical protein AZKH_4195 [Azoarcus sp. KH32C]